jgi:hypothetical protein
MSNERDSVSDRLALEQFKLVRNLAYIAAGVYVALIAAYIAFPKRVNIEVSGATSGLLTILAYFLNPPGTQRKKEPEQQAIAQSGGLIVQEQGSDRAESES